MSELDHKLNNAAREAGCRVVRASTELAQLRADLAEAVEACKAASTGSKGWGEAVDAVVAKHEGRQQ